MSSSTPLASEISEPTPPASTNPLRSELATLPPPKDEPPSASTPAAPASESLAVSTRSELPRVVNSTTDELKSSPTTEALESAPPKAELKSSPPKADLLRAELKSSYPDIEATATLPPVAPAEELKSSASELKSSDTPASDSPSSAKPLTTEAEHSSAASATPDAPLDASLESDETTRDTLVGRARDKAKAHLEAKHKKRVEKRKARVEKHQKVEAKSVSVLKSPVTTAAPTTAAKPASSATNTVAEAPTKRIHATAVYRVVKPHRKPCCCWKCPCYRRVRHHCRYSF